MIDLPSVRRRYDAEMRRDPPAPPGCRVERDGTIVRLVGRENMVIFSDLRGEDAAAAVARQAERFRTAAVELEWKLFGDDRPAELRDLLAGAGFLPDEPETLLVYDLHDGVPGKEGGSEIEVRRVADAGGVRDASEANVAAFGTGHRAGAFDFAALALDPAQAILVAYSDGRPVASGRIEMPPGRSFAGLYGGGTAPEHRHRGVYRRLVAARAELAARAGYRYLTVDARETSRPILERLGFRALVGVQGWVLTPDPRERPRPPDAGR